MAKLFKELNFFESLLRVESAQKLSCSSSGPSYPALYASSLLLGGRRRRKDRTTREEEEEEELREEEMISEFVKIGGGKKWIRLVKMKKRRLSFP